MSFQWLNNSMAQSGDTTQQRITLTFTSPGYRNTTIVDDENRSLYAIETPPDPEPRPIPFVPSPTSVYRVAPDGSRALVALIEWRTVGYTTMKTDNGRNVQELDSVFRQKKRPSKSRFVPVALGIWRWTNRKGVLELLNESENSVARYICPQDTVTPLLELEPSLHRMPGVLDMSILGWIAMMRDIEFRKDNQGGGWSKMNFPLLVGRALQAATSL